MELQTLHRRDSAETAQDRDFRHGSARLRSTRARHGNCCSARQFIRAATAVAPRQERRMKTNIRKLPVKRAVVTGGAGFLGSHLCSRLLREGYSVVAIDNLASGSAQNIEPLRRYDTFKFIRHDITVPIDVEADYIFNLACCASPQHYQRDPEKTVRTCTEGAVNMLHLAERYGARVFQASTSEVYGEPEVHPQRESYRGAVSPIGPRACYDEGKRCAEALFFDYH